MTKSNVYFDALRPRKFTGGQPLKSSDVDSYATGIGIDGKAYYWGNNGYVATATTKRSCENEHPERTGLCAGQDAGVNQDGFVCGYLDADAVYTTTTTYQPIGQSTVTGPLYNTTATLFGQRTFATTSGNAYDGLFCAKLTTAPGITACDTHGSNTNVGQTGSGYNQSCGYQGFFQYVCSIDPAGPQPITVPSWLIGKTITQLSTSSPGNYACAIADGNLGCWGANSMGQLGVGDTNNRNIPTKVAL